MPKMKYYIKERHNPQTGTYYILQGKISKEKAKKMEQSAYGTNVMLSYETKEDYENAIAELKQSDERVYLLKQESR